MSKPQGFKYWHEREADDPHLDWGEGENWINGFWESVKHPHRKLLMEKIVEQYPFDSLLEVGCSCGPNLALIKKKFPKSNITGVDVNYPSILEGENRLKDITFTWAKADNLPFTSKSFDVILTDAVLMYVAPEEIKKTLKELLRVAKKSLVLCEWVSASKLGEIKYYHWCRDYEALLQEMGLKTTMTNITYEDWPSKNWADVGAIITGKL